MPLPHLSEGKSDTVKLSKKVWKKHGNAYYFLINGRLNIVAEGDAAEWWETIFVLIQWRKTMPHNVHNMAVHLSVRKTTYAIRYFTWP